MNLRDLRYFVALAEARHFGRAAERSFVSQPTLSGQIRKLEEELGAPLFERGARSVSLTPLGEALLPHARQALEQAEMLVELARAQRDPLSGPLRLGAIPTLAPYLLPVMLPAVAEALPKLELAVAEDLTAALIERLRGRELDAILVATPVEAEEFAVRPLFDEPFYAALPPGHALARKRSLSRAEVASLDLLLLAEGHCLAAQVEELCRSPQGALRGRPDLRAASLVTLVELVAGGRGATLVPALATRTIAPSARRTVLRPVDAPGASRRVSIVWRRSFPRPRAVQALADATVARLPGIVTPLGSQAAGTAAQATQRSQSGAGSAAS